MTITQTITNFPAAPDSATDTPSVFNTKANAFVGHQSGVYVGEVNTWAAECNAVRDDINNIVATLPAGVIDDTTPSLTNTYSSNKIEDDIKAPIASNSKWVGIVLADQQALRDFYGDQSITVAGANFSAKSYPDGSVVGSTDNGNFTMRANGSLDCTGISTGDAIAIVDVVFPIQNIAIPFVGIIVKSSVSRFSTVTSSITADGFPFKVFSYDGTATASAISWNSVGRWK